MDENVLIVVNSLSLGGGTERIATEVGTYLHKRGYNVTFLARYDTQLEYDFEGEYFYRYDDRENNAIKKIIRELKGPKKISEICKEKNISTVFSFSYSPNFCSILSKILFDNESKIVISVRNNPLKLLPKSLQIFSKILYPKADTVVAQTKRIKKILEGTFSVNDCVVIPNMIDLDKYKKLSKKPLPKQYENIFGKQDFIFITIGSLTYQKAQWHLIRCFKKVQQEKENTKLIVLGAGPLKEKLKKMAKKMEIENKILFLGKVENVFPYLRHSDCFVFSSLYEGFPNVLLEALSMDLPIISTDCVSGPRDILCPEYQTSETVQYPCYGKFGVLTESFEEEIFFKDLNEKSLSKKEKIFAETMIELVGKNKFGNKYQNVSYRTEEFEKNKIMNKWEKLI